LHKLTTTTTTSTTLKIVDKSLGKLLCLFSPSSSTSTTLNTRGSLLSLLSLLSFPLSLKQQQTPQTQRHFVNLRHYIGVLRIHTPSNNKNNKNNTTNPKQSKNPTAMSKKGEVEIKPTLGRPGNNLKMGIVGLPNVGKSSLFNILCKMSIPAENFPFCTIDPNISRCPVPDERYDWLCSVHKPGSEIPAFLHVTDIAGLVKGASAGAGLGNNFLSHIQAVDGIFHMIRAFDDTDVVHVEESVDPIRDLDIIHAELIAKDIEWVTRSQEASTKTLRGKPKDKVAQEHEACLEKALELLNSGKHVRFHDWSGKEIEILNELRLLTAKPALYLVNLSSEDFIRKKNKWLAKIKGWVDEHGGGPIIPLSVGYEKQLLDLPSDADRLNFESEKGAPSVIPKIAKTGYQHLQLIYFFTAGSDEVRCWTIQKNTKAPQAAGVIHTDFENGFIMAEVISFNDYKECNASEVAAKAAGKFRMEGKLYIVQDGDVMHFKFNPGAGSSGGKKK